MTVRLDAGLSERLLLLGGPAALVLLGLVGAVRGGLWTPGGVMLVAGLVLVLAVAVVSPWAVTFGADGIERRTLVGRRTFAWEDVDAIERPGRRNRRGLVLLQADGRRVVLSTSDERPDVWDRLRELVGEVAPHVDVGEPPPDHPFRRA